MRQARELAWALTEALAAAEVAGVLGQDSEGLLLHAALAVRGVILGEDAALDGLQPPQTAVDDPGASGGFCGQQGLVPQLGEGGGVLVVTTPPAQGHGEGSAAPEDELGVDQDQTGLGQVEAVKDEEQGCQDASADGA